MLGRVFEGVMDGGERRASGTYYTPAPIVRDLVRAALEAALVHRLHLAPEAAARWVHDRAAPLHPPALRTLTTLAPAAGPGAFPPGPPARPLAATLSGDAHRPEARAELARAAAARRALYTLTGPRKRDATRELAAAEAQLARRLIDRGLERIEARIAELLATARTRDLFGHRPGLGADQRVRLGRLRAARRDLRDARRRLARDGGAPFFAFEPHFGDPMARGGLDAALGNPPWVRGAPLPPRP